MTNDYSFNFFLPKRRSRGAFKRMKPAAKRSGTRRAAENNIDCSNL
jgi:hypothetical protein